MPTSFVSLWHVTLAQHCRQLGSLRAEPRRVSHGQCSQPRDGYTGAKLEQGRSQAAQSHPKQIWLALKVPGCHPWQMLHRHPELCDQRQHAPLEAHTLLSHWGVTLCSRETHLGS